jgi:RimJ/RimL family protein N-acetyltransferase/quercetin dioxygenase-like cupin family protein
MGMPTPQVLSTARTHLRPFELTDADAAFAWFSDPEVMRYIPSEPDATVRQTEERIGRYIEHGRKHGFSKWIILDEKTGAPMGDAGFYTIPDSDRVELGYRLARKEWGKGLATEIAARWLEVAPEWYGFREVFAFAHPENASSLHVMEKLGFRYSHMEKIYGMEAPLHRLLLTPEVGAPVTHISPTMSHIPQALHIPDGSGATFSILGLETTVKVTAAQSDGAYVVYEQIVSPGMGVPPHVHTREDEIFFVLDGQMEFLAGDQMVVAKPGAVVYAPRNVPHAYKAVGVTPAKVRFIASPGEIEDMFAQLASWPSDVPPDLGKLGELCAKFGISFV